MTTLSLSSIYYLIEWNVKHAGARRDSATYVRMKKKACTEIGIESFGTDFDATVTQEELIAKIDELNASK